MSAHTPGPWVLANAGQQIRSIAGEPLANVWEDPPGKANARLMASAPDLLAALIMVRDADDDCKRDGLPSMPPCARACIDATIAKATGGAS